VSDETETSAAAPTVADFTSPGARPSPVDGQGGAASGAAQVAADRPELVVGGAFAAGFLFAKLLRRRGN
jgi:hypothetical protein